MITDTKEKTFNPPVVQLIQESQQFDISNNLLEVADANLKLFELLTKWKQSFQNPINNIGDNTYIVIPDGPKPVVFNTDNHEKWDKLLIPMVDNLNIVTPAGTCVLRIEDRIKGGCQVSVSRDTNMSKSTIDFSRLNEVRAEMSRENPDFVKISEIEHGTPVQSFGKVILTGGVGDRQWVDKVMQNGDNFRIDEIKGGLIAAVSWGPVQFIIR